MNVTESMKRTVAFRSGNLCAKCHTELTVDYADGSVRAIGECAHIAGEHGGDSSQNISPAARYDPNMTDEERNSFQNLIYLCGKCHRKIDKIPEGERNYPVPYLKKLKAEHESKVRQATMDAFPDIGFEELAVAIRWTTTISSTGPTNNYTLLDVAQKMQKNSISDANLALMQMGLSVAPVVKSFIENISKTDQDLPERLRDGFLEYYYKLRHKGARGDELFESMCQFAQRGLGKPKEQVAGLAVLIYMFEACEVFEK